MNSTSIPHLITLGEKKERLEKPEECLLRPKTVYVVLSKISSWMPSTKEISYASFFSNIQKAKTEMTSFSDVNINTIGFSHNRIRRIPRISRYSLAVPDTNNIPPSQSAAYIEPISFASSV